MIFVGGIVGKHGWAWLTMCSAAALAIGAGAGFYFGHGGSHDLALRPDLYATAQSRYTSFLFSVRRDGSSVSDEGSLRSYVAYLDMQAHERDAGRRNLYAFDKALALTRLSEFARRRGATDDVLRLAEGAEASCAATGLRHCSANELLRTTRERDRAVWLGQGG